MPSMTLKLPHVRLELLSVRLKIPPARLMTSSRKRCPQEATLSELPNLFFTR